MKPMIILMILTMFCSLSGVKGHFMRGMWLGTVGLLVSVMVYQAGLNTNKIVAWGFYINHMSSWLVMLTFLVSFLAIATSTSGIQWNSPNSQKSFGSAVVMISLLVSLCFVLSNLLWFYMVFEGSLIPMFFLIAGWGSYQERVGASIHMIMYTVGASLPFLLLIGCCTVSLNKPLFAVIKQEVTILAPSIICYSSMMAFLVKLPMYPFHMWLPKAHVEAPTAGSMILAGIMLKLGGFGLICSLIMFSSLYSNGNLWVISTCAMWGGMLAMLHCILQMDLKAAIAYSSVAHMSLVIYGAVAMNNWGYCASTMIMVSHALTSSGLFCLAHWIMELTGARLLSVISGLMLTSRSLSLWGILLFSANIPTPPWLSMVGEVMMMPAIFSNEKHILVIIPLMVMMFLSAVFNLCVYTELFQGSPTQVHCGRENPKMSHLTLYGHLSPLVGMMIIIGKLN